MHKKLSIFKRIIDLLKLINKASPMHTLFTLIVIILEKTSSMMLRINAIVYIIQYFEGEISAPKCFMNLICIILFKTLSVIINKIYGEIYSPLSNIKIKKFIDKSIYEKTMKFSYESYENVYHKKFSEVIFISSDKCISAHNYFIKLLSSIYSIIYIFVMLLKIDYTYIYIVILPIITSIILGKLSNKIYLKYYNNKIIGKRKHRFIGQLFTYKNFQNDLLSTNIINLYNCELLNIKNQMINNELSNKKIIILFNFLYMIISDVVIYLLCLAISSNRFFNGEILLSDILIIITMINNMINVVWMITDVYISLDKNLLFVDQYVDFMSINTANESNIIINEIKRIEFRNVDFKYINNNAFSLNKINLIIHQGDKIAIIGNNGTGKSTLINLILGLYNNYKGDILVNNINIRNLNKEHYLNLFTLMQQEYQLYPINIYDNITLGKTIEKEKIEFYLSKYFDEEFSCKVLNNLFEMPKNLYCIAKGIEFSQGEIQKIVILRMLLQNKKTIILDESFSNIDKENRYEILNKLISYNKDKTIIIITHDYNELKYVNTVYQIIDGNLFSAKNEV